MINKIISRIKLLRTLLPNLKSLGIIQLYPPINNGEYVKRIIDRLKTFPIFCNVCGKISYVDNYNPNNIRESCTCHFCNSTTRQRQIASVLCNKIRIKSLNKIYQYDGYIYNTESYGPIHNQLLKAKNYICSEYFGIKYKSGSKINNILNEDLTKLSFKSDCFDVVLSSDVFEHIPNPYTAHKEVHRVLKENGCHIFTVPFYENQYLDETRAVVINKKIKNILPPTYHQDGIRPKKGILVFTIFSLEMLVKLKKIGFNTVMYHAQSKIFGFTFHSSTVFCSEKN